MADPAPFEIAPTEAGQVASNGANTLTLIGAGQMFRRRAVKHIGTAAVGRAEWAVAELNGVRCYFDGTHAILTTQDMVP